MGAGMAGACAAGTCSGGVAAGGCSGPGGCGMGGSCASLLYFLDLALMETDSQQGYGDMGGGCGGSGGCGGGGGGCGGGGECNLPTFLLLVHSRWFYHARDFLS